MKFPSVVLGVLVAAACGDQGVAGPGAPDPDELGAIAADAELAPFESLREAGRGGGNGSPQVRRALVAGANRLAALQADTIGDNARNGLVDSDPDDGGWDFIFPSTTTSHTPTVSFPNLYGETALGAWAAVVGADAGNRALSVALDAGLAMQRNPDIDSPPDFAFGVLLADLADNPGFAEIAREHYDARLAAAGGAAALGIQIRDARHAGNHDGLIAYDVGWLAISATALDLAFPGAGYDADADLYAKIVVDAVASATPLFDIDDPAEGDYVIGLAWAQVSAVRLGQGDLFRDIRARLLDQQHSNGSWPTNATLSGDDLQSTAIAVETLALTGRTSGRAQQAMRRGVRFLLGEQAANGGWADADGNELPLVDAEIMLGLMLARTPEGRDGLPPDGVSPARAPRSGPRAAGSLPYATPLP
jgi:hypothetical protein